MGHMFFRGFFRSTENSRPCNILATHDLIRKSMGEIDGKVSAQVANSAAKVPPVSVIVRLTKYVEKSRIPKQQQLACAFLLPTGCTEFFFFSANFPVRPFFWSRDTHVADRVSSAHRRCLDPQGILCLSAVVGESCEREDTGTLEAA